MKNMTWQKFVEWLEQNGVRFFPGDVHYAGRGYWYPVPPELDGSEAPKPPPPWILVEQDRAAAAMFISTSFSEAVYAESPEAAQAAVETALMNFDTATGFGGHDADVSPSCDDGFHVRCHDQDRCQCACHGTGIKKCTTCPKRYDTAAWKQLDLIGEQFVEGDEEGPAYTLEMRNCTCGTTLAINRE